MKTLLKWMIGFTLLATSAILVYRTIVRPQVEELTDELAEEFDYEDVWSQLPA